MSKTHKVSHEPGKCERVECAEHRYAINSISIPCEHMYFGRWCVVTIIIIIRCSSQIQKKRLIVREWTQGWKKSCNSNQHSLFRIDADDAPLALCAYVIHWEGCGGRFLSLAKDIVLLFNYSTNFLCFIRAHAFVSLSNDFPIWRLCLISLARWQISSKHRRQHMGRALRWDEDRRRGMHNK